MNNELPINQNLGVLTPEKISETDFNVSGISGIEYKILEENGDWLQYHGVGERQHGVYFDSMACVTFSALNSIEMQINRLIIKKLLPVETLQALQTLGYLNDYGLFNVSDRFTAKMSGTTRVGNYLTKVWDSVRNDGLIPQNKYDFPNDQRTPVFDWDNFYAEIDQSLKNAASEIFKYFSFSYEWVYTNNGMTPNQRKDLILQHLKHAPLQIAAPVCRGWNEGDKTAVPYCDINQPQHATVIAKVADNGCYSDFDSYIPYSKLLALDYPILYIMKGVVEMKKPIEQLPTKFGYVFDVTKPILYGQKSELVKQLQRALVFLNYLSPQYVTSFYWTKTQAAVLKFQTDHQVDTPEILLELNGKRAGTKTLTKLNQLLTQ